MLPIIHRRTDRDQNKKSRMDLLLNKSSGTLYLQPKNIKSQKKRLVNEILRRLDITPNPSKHRNILFIKSKKSFLRHNPKKKRFEGPTYIASENLIDAMFGSTSPYRRDTQKQSPFSIFSQKMRLNTLVSESLIKQLQLDFVDYQQDSYSTFWNKYISNFKQIRWDIFQERMTFFLIKEVLHTLGMLRKLNWKKLFENFYQDIGEHAAQYSLWPKCFYCKEQWIYEGKVVRFDSFKEYVISQNMKETIVNSFSDSPCYLSQIREGKSYQYACGSVYQGRFKEGIRCGEGVLTLNTGETIRSQFLDGYTDGFSKIKGQFEYRGEVKQEVYQGFGIMKWKDMEFVGNFEENLVVKGVLSFDGARYEGEFGNFGYHGKGKLVTKQGVVYSGTWKNGRLQHNGYLSEVIKQHLQKYPLNNK